MPADIRNFFSGKAAEQGPKQDKVAGPRENSGAGNKRRSKARVILDDSDDDDEPPKSKESAPRGAVLRNAVKKQSPVGKETTTSDYFASSNKAKASKRTPTKAKSRAVESSPGKRLSDEAKKQPSAKPESSGRAGSRGTIPTKSYVEYDAEGDGTVLNDDADGGEDIFAAELEQNKRRNNGGYIDSESDDQAAPTAKTATIRARPRLRKSKDRETMDVDSDEPFILSDADKVVTRDQNSKIRGTSSTGLKRKSPTIEDEDEDDSEASDPTKTGSKAKKSKRPPTKKTRAREEDVPESAELQAIFDSIPIVKAPSPPLRDPDKKFDWRAGGQANSGPPPSAGAKEIPTGAENCLAGLTFVFTGLLETISREAGQELVKRYGGRVTGTPSSKTSYVVLGSDAGPSKLEKIRSMNIKTVNEDGLFELIRRLPASGGGGKLAEKSLEKKRAEEEKTKRDAAEMEKEEKRTSAEAEKAAQQAAAARGITPRNNVSQKSTFNSQLWTTKYAPTKTNQICGNKGQVEKIQKWLQRWPEHRRHNFMLAGQDGSGKYRAIIIHGPPGIGKTTAAHLAAKLEGYDVIESNASDTRSKKLVESGLSEVLNNSSLLGFFAGDGKEVSKQRKKIVLIMDEVDGMSAGDRGGVGALAKVCKKTEVPMILICNERRIPKLKPFDHVAYDIQFKRPTVEQVRSRVATICAREGLKIPTQVMDALIEGSNKDIRQIINMLSSAKLDQSSMDFDQGKSMSKAWEKHIVLKPWDICHKLLGSGMFAPSSTATLNDKIELYFNDHELSYLMVQENYLTTRPMIATNQVRSPKEHNLKILELVDKATESISDGDLVDRMIHGSQQQWSLMPTHAVFSTVRPASFMSGAMTGNTSFSQWLGNNSKYGKLSRYVKEIQSHMRLRTSGDRHEIRQQYLPVLWERLIRRLEIEGKDCVNDVIDLMDNYFLTRDDFDYIMELGLGPQDQSGVTLSTATKSTFTRLYNGRPHPLPFMKASSAAVPQKAPKAAPDLEEAVEEEDDGDALVEELGDVDDENVDILKDKYIKKAKAQKSGAPKENANKKGKKRAKIEDDADEESEDEMKSTKNRSGKAKGKTVKGKGRAKK